MTDDSRKTFTVTDRRHFTPEGEVRAPDEAPAPAARPAEPPPAATPPSASSGPAGPSGAPGTPATEPDDDLPFPVVPTDLSGLVASLAAQAAYVLAAPVRDAAQAKSALESARSVITLLEVLRDKTEGHRTREEDEVLVSVLYELRMGYVARTRAGGA